TGRTDKDAVIHTSLRPLKVAGIDGRLLHGKNPGDIPVPDGMSYVVVDRDAVTSDVLNTDTTAMHLYEMSDSSRTKKSLSPVVLQTLVGKEKQVQVDTEGYWYKPSENETKLEYAIRVNNLSDK